MNYEIIKKVVKAGENKAANHDDFVGFGRIEVEV